MGDFSILAIRIKELRASLNMTQKEFSALVSCTAATLSAYENGSKSPSLEIIKGMAEKCHVSIDWLCGLTDKKTYSEEIKTFGDVIHLLLKLEAKIDICVYYELIPSSNFSLIDNASIKFKNGKMIEFIMEWEKMKKLHDELTIDDDVYNLWIEKTIKKYNVFPALRKDCNAEPSDTPQE